MEALSLSLSCNDLILLIVLSSKLPIEPVGVSVGAGGSLIA